MIVSAVSLAALVAAILLVTVPSAYCMSNARIGSCTGALGIGIFLASLLFLVALATGVVACIMGMLQAADEKRWGWFVVVLLLGAIGSLAYGLARPAAAIDPGAGVTSPPGPSPKREG
jgi:hypothetical protein